MKRIGTGKGAALLLCLAAGCADGKEAAPVEEAAPIRVANLGITNGDPVDDKTYKSIGMLLARANISENGAPAVNRIMGICTGTIISPTAVLSAEHCVNQMILEQSLAQAKDANGQPRNLKIEGEIMFQFTFSRKIADVQANMAEVFTASTIDHHADFAPIANPLAALTPAPAKWDDIAIVHFATPIANRRYQKIATPEIVAALKIDTASMYRVAGYGLTNDDDPMSAGNLTSGLSHLDKIGDNEITAGNKDVQQACRGDSGGPIFASQGDDYQIGVASRVNRPLTLEDIIKGISGTATPPPCETGLAYTRVDAYTTWITERVPDLPDPNAPYPPDEPDAGTDDDAGTDPEDDAGANGGGSNGTTGQGTNGDQTNGNSSSNSSGSNNDGENNGQGGTGGQTNGANQGSSTGAGGNGSTGGGDGGGCSVNQAGSRSNGLSLSLLILAGLCFVQRVRARRSR
jgi:hypothetical protein